jgi:hypothetical protein
MLTPTPVQLQMRFLTNRPVREGWAGGADEVPGITVELT